MPGPHTKDIGPANPQCGRLINAVKLAGALLILLGLILIAMALCLLSAEAACNTPWTPVACSQLTRLSSEVRNRLLTTLAVAGVTALGLGSLAWVIPHACLDLILRSWRIAKRELRTLRSELSAGGLRNDMYFAAIPSLIGCILRLRFIDRPIHFDEAYTFMRLAERPWHIAVSNYAYPNNHILHTILVKATCSFFGGAEWAIRLPAFSAGVLLITATYLLTRIAADRKAAFVAAFLVAVSPRAVNFSVDGRGYTLQALLLTLGAAALLWALADGGIRKFAIFALCCWLAFWTLPTTLFFFIGTSIWFIIEAVKKKKFTQNTLLSRYFCSAATIILLTAISYLPALVYSGWHSLARNKFVSGKSLRTFLEGNRTELSIAWLESMSPWFSGAGLAFWSLAVVYLLIFWKKSASARLFAWLLFGTGMVILLRRMAPFARVYFFLLPFFFCAVAIVLTRPWPGLRTLQAKAVDVRIRIVTAGVLGLFLGYRVWNSRYVADSFETGALLSAKVIAKDLQMAVASSQCIGGTIVPALTVKYYLHRHGGAGKEKGVGLNCEGAFVIVNEAAGETEEIVLERLGLTGIRYTVWKKYRDALVLRLEGNGLP